MPGQLAGLVFLPSYILERDRIVLMHETSVFVQQNFETLAAISIPVRSQINDHVVIGVSIEINRRGITWNARKGAFEHRLAIFVYDHKFIAAFIMEKVERPVERLMDIF